MSLDTGKSTIFDCFIRAYPLLPVISYQQTFQISSCDQVADSERGPATTISSQAGDTLRSGPQSRRVVGCVRCHGAESTSLSSYSLTHLHGAGSRRSALHLR